MTKKKTVTPGTDIVASMTKDFRKEQVELIESGITELTINMAGIKMVDSVGIGVLIALHNTLNQREGKLIITNASPDIYKLFKTMRLDKHFKINHANG